MRRILLTGLLAVGLIGSVAKSANAQVIGPVCLKTAEFPNTFMFFFTPHGTDHFMGTGRDLLTPRALTGSLFIAGGTALLSFTGGIPPEGPSHSFAMSANISLAANSGPGRCESMNTTGGCGAETAITMSIVTCPEIASDAAASAHTDVATAKKDPGGQ